MYTILIVDDEDSIRNAFVKAVDWESIGFRILGQASNGVEALDFIEQNDIDLLITDIMMPIMGGIELVREVRELKPNIQIVFLSGHEEFQFAKQAIRYNILDYMLKPITKDGILEEFARIKKALDGKFSEILDIDTQIDSMKELQEMKRELFFTKLITNGILREEVDEFFIHNNLAITGRVEAGLAYAIFITKLKEVEVEESYLANKRLLNIVQIISRKYIACESLLYGNRIVTIACDKTQSLDKYSSTLSKDIILTAKRILGIDASFAQSNYYKELTQSYFAYIETKDAINSIEKTDEPIIHINDLLLKKGDLEIQERLLKLEGKLIAADKEEVSMLLIEIFDCLNDKSIHTTEFNAYMLEILSVMFKARRMLEEESEVKTLISNYFTFHGTREMAREEITKLGLGVVDGIIAQRQNTVGHLVSQAREIIANQYGNSEMNLRMLANELNCSPNYLSSNIKKSLGKSFVELLVEARMKKAKEMLLTTNKKIREISEECGFTNQHYFSYSFKKYFNVSPNLIRKENMQVHE